MKKLRDGGGDDAPPAATLALAVLADLQIKPERLTLGTEIGRGGCDVTHTTTTAFTPCSFLHDAYSEREGMSSGHPNPDRLPPHSRSEVVQTTAQFILTRHCVICTTLRFAVVFRGKYTSGGRETAVAYKRIELGGAATPDDMKMIAREVQLMHGVALHPNVVTLLGTCADPRAVDAAGASVGVGLMIEVCNGI